MRQKKYYKPSSGSGQITYNSYGEDMRIYLYHVANIYRIISREISTKIGDEEITLGDEGKKLIALYLAAGTDYVRHKTIKTMLRNSEAFRENWSRFKKSEAYTSCGNTRISDDEASQIISRNFSELLNHRTNKFYTMKVSFPGPSTLIVMQTLKVASVKETNPIYWVCKMTDGIKNTNLAENYVSSIFSMYKSAIKHNYLGAIFPLTLSSFEKKVSFEKKKEIPKKLKSDSGIHGVSSERDKQSSEVEQAVEDNTEAVQEYSDEEIKEHIRKLDEEREKRIKLLNQQEQDRAREFRQFQSRLNEAARPIQQSDVEQLDKLLTQQGYDTSKFRTGTAGFRPGTSDLGEMGKMFGDKSIGDTSKSDDKGRHL